MNEQNEEKTILYIPLGINTRMDYWAGFGKVELLQALVGIFLGILLSILGYAITNQSLTVIVIMLFSIGCSLGATTKGSTNMSMVDFVNYAIKFSKSQKIFPYRQMLEWT